MPKLIAIRSSFQRIDLQLLLYLLLFLNVKMAIKVAAIVLLLLVNRKYIFTRNAHRPGFTWFYASMIFISIINLLFGITSVPGHYFFVLLVGISFWLICLAAAYLNTWFVTKIDLPRMHYTIRLFYILNTIVTIIQLLYVMWDAKTINPYTFQGMHQKYFMGTGDRMTGITLDISITNALLNAFGIVYFLRRDKFVMVVLCMLVLLLTGSNYTNILLVLVLLWMLVFQSTRDQKSMILACFAILVIFMLRITPQNDQYITEAYKKISGKKTPRTTITNDSIPLKERPDSTLGIDERKQKIAILYLDSLHKVRKEIMQEEGLPVNSFVKPDIPPSNLSASEFQRLKDTLPYQHRLITLEKIMLQDADSTIIKEGNSKWPGKLLALEQTYHYMKDHPRDIFTGTGMGNFSSKLAFRATGLQIAGGFPSKFAYINQDFMDNHLQLYLRYFIKDKELHSLINTPNSSYDQLIAEYGLAGIIAFLLLYMGFFVRRIRRLTYGIPLLLILLGAFFMDYWYEQLSIVILFELLMLINIKEIKQS